MAYIIIQFKQLLQILRYKITIVYPFSIQFTTFYTKYKKNSLYIFE